MMPTYPYRCHSCSALFEIVKPVSAIDEPTTCKCGAFAVRYIGRTNFTGASDWNKQTFHPALGCFTKSDAHARKIARARGMEEVGTEAPDKLHTHFDKQREETRGQRWADAEREKVYGD